VANLRTRSVDLEGNYMPQIGDTSTFKIGTENVPYGEGILGSVKFSQYGEIDKNVR
jgi:hypothetical protein